MWHFIILGLAGISEALRNLHLCVFLLVSFILFRIVANVLFPLLFLFLELFYHVSHLGMTQQKEDEKNKRALKAINHPPAKPRNPPKPRQSLLPPKVTAIPPKPATSENDGVKMRTPSKNVPGFRYAPDTKTTARNSQTDGSSGAESETPATRRTSRLTPSTRRPGSQVSVASSKSSTTSKGPPSTRTITKPITKAIKKPNEFERKLIHHYKRVSRISTVMSLTAGNMAVQLDALQFKYNLGNDTIAAKNLEINHLQTATANCKFSFKKN